MTTSPFLDTNILLRHLLQDQTDHSSRATALLRKVARGEMVVYTSETVFFEAVYVLHKQFGIAKHQIAEGLHDVLGLAGMIVPNRDSLLAALTFWTEHGGLSFADCFHLALTDHWGLGRIYTFDQKMDRYPGVLRMEP